MTQWPEPENKLAPEGHYSFRLNKEPDLRKFTDKNGKENRRLVIFAIALGPTGNYPIMDSFVPWEPRYSDLCKALGVEHGRDIEMKGAIFEADIKHEPSAKDPSQVYARICNIVTGTEAPDAGDDIPF